MNGTSELQAHSPLGGSGAYRWMACPGSVSLSRGIHDEESEHAALGTAAHTLAEHCLRTGEEPWQLIGQGVNDKGVVPYTPLDGFLQIDKEMADSIQAYMDCISEWHPDRNQGNSWIERRFHCPNIHKYFYGASDFTYLEGRTLNTWDYKHGVGIVVEAENNPQLLYYAAGMLEDLDAWELVDRVRLHIYQPRGWHWQGPHRYWEVETGDVIEWLEDVCIPAMDYALVSTDTVTGEHCRFCPARQAQCPALMNDMAEYEELLMAADENKGEGAQALTPEQLGRLLCLNEVAKIAMKAAQKTAHGMLTTGKTIPGCKLVKSRTNRTYKPGAEEAAIDKFGEQKALTKPALKSPAQIDEMPEGKTFTAQWAFKPEGGTTIAVEGDPRRAIKRDVKSLFKPVK